jgi:hypothetical protein
MLGWAALVYAGARARRRGWVAAGVLYAVLTVTGFTLDDDGGWVDELSYWLVLVTWGATIAHALVVRPAYLRLTDPIGGELQRAATFADRRREARRLASEEPVRALEMGVGRPDLPGGFDGGVIDLNNAPVDAIATLPGIGGELAERIVAVRDEINGFSSLDDVGHVLHLSAATVDRIRLHAVALPRGVESDENA